LMIFLIIDWTNFVYYELFIIIGGSQQFPRHSKKFTKHRASFSRRIDPPVTAWAWPTYYYSQNSTRQGLEHSIVLTQIGSSPFDTTRFDTFNVSSPCTCLSNSSIRSTLRTCRVVSRRDEPSGIWAYAKTLNTHAHQLTHLLLCNVSQDGAT